MIARFQRELLRLAPLCLLVECAWTTSVVNLSHYDANPRLDLIAKEGVVATIHEATYPIGNVDAEYAARQSQANRAGLLWGAYHFADATDPVRQADHFLKVAAENKSPEGVLLVLDFERNGHYPGGTMRAEQAAAFVERIRAKTGRYPGVYMSENRITKVLGNPAVSEEVRNSLSHCWLWIANYHHKPIVTGPWRRWNLWQYTGDGVCELPRSEYPIKVANLRFAERNVFDGSAGGVRTFWRDHAWRP